MLANLNGKPATVASVNEALSSTDGSYTGVTGGTDAETLKENSNDTWQNFYNTIYGVLRDTIIANINNATAVPNEYTITWKNASKTITTTTGTYGQPTQAPSAPVKNNYIFKGWTNDPEGTTPITLPNVSGPATYYAIFERDPNGTDPLDRSLANVRYVSVGTGWKTTSDYETPADESDDGKLYAKVNGEFYPVQWEVGQELYAPYTSNSWKPGDIGASTEYFYNTDADTAKLNFSQVTTGTGTLYAPSNDLVTVNNVPRYVFGDNIIGYEPYIHLDYRYYMTKYFVKGNDVTTNGGYSRMQVVTIGKAAGYNGWCYYFKDGRYNEATPSATEVVDSTDGPIGSISELFDGWDPNRPDPGASDYWGVPADRTIVKVNNKDYADYKRTSTTHISTTERDLTFATTLYEPTTGYNSLWYNNGASQLGSTVYDADTAAYNGPLYFYDAAHTGTTRLTYKVSDTAEPQLLGTTSRITDDVIYTGDLYKLVAVPVADPPVVNITPGEESIHTDKTLTANNAGSYDITLDTYTTGNTIVTETTQTEQNPLDIVLVIDQSSSMATKDMGATEYLPAKDANGTEITSWTVSSATGGEQYYYYADGKYYPVQAKSGTIFEKETKGVVASDLVGWGDDFISLGVNGAPTFYNVKTNYYVEYNGELHRMYLITAGLFGDYGLYPYIYTDNSDPYASAAKWSASNYWVAIFDPWDGSDLRDNSTWNTLASNGRIRFVLGNGTTLDSSDSSANTAKQSYQWLRDSAHDEWLGSGKGVTMTNLYKVSETKGANQLYYVNDRGIEVPIGKTAQRTTDVVYSDRLFVANGTSRMQALQDAVRTFVSEVQLNAKTYNVTHRMAIVGFASNVLPDSYSGSTTLGANKMLDYADTGLFVPGGFVNYQSITGYKAESAPYFINTHYFVGNSGTTPVRYNYGEANWYNVFTGATVEASNFYSSERTPLTDANYTSALMNVNVNDDVNQNLTNAINSFATYGGTYTSYGMEMAEKLLSKTASTAPDDAKRIVVVFTDGEPGANGYNSSIAGESLVSSSNIKNSDVDVYTIGLFKGNVTSQVESFMKQLSSEYKLSTSNVYAGSSNYGAGNLDPDKTYYYQDETSGKYYAVTAQRAGASSLGWWIYNSDGSYILTTPKSSTGAGATKFYSDANGSNSVQANDVKTNRTYYTENGRPIVYEYRWYDSDNSIVNPKTSASSDGEQFLELSSPVKNGTKSYYMKADNARDLSAVFSEITGEVTARDVSVTTKLNDNATYVSDVVSADFDLPADPNAAVKVYSVPVTFENGQPVFHEDEKVHLVNGTVDEIETGRADVTVTWEGKKLTVEHFDFARNYVAEGNEAAAMLRIVIEGVTPNKAGDPNDTGNPANDAKWALYSNTTAGLYNKTSGGGAETIQLFDRPSVPVPGYTVSWVSDDAQIEVGEANTVTVTSGELYDQDTLLIKGNVPVYDGGEPTKDTDNDNTYSFDGWENRESGQIIPKGEAFPAVSDGNVTYYAHFAATPIERVTVTWLNAGTQMDQQQVIKGTEPVYGGTIPAKNEDETYTYFFAGWSSDAAYAQENVIPYKASYTKEDIDALNLITTFPAANSDMTYYAVFAPVKIGSRTFVVDYGTEHLLEKQVKSIEILYALGGTFNLKKAEGAETGDFSFTPKMDTSGGFQKYIYTKNREFKVFDLTGMSDVNTAIYYKDQDGNTNVATRANVVAASSIYLDDSITDVHVKAYDNEQSNFAVLNDQEYKNALKAVGKDADDTTVLDNAQPVAFTFTGTGIEIYAKTYNDSGYISVYLLGADGKRYDALDRNGAKQKQGVRDVTSDDLLYNVPVIRYEDLPHGTYTVVILPTSDCSFQLDGVRVFNANTTQQAKYLNVREALLAANPLVDDDGNPIEALFDGAFYLVGKDATKDVAEYTKSGPKNEVYLDKGDSVAFIVPVGSSNHRIGLSAVDGTATAADKKNVTVSYGVNDADEAQDTQYTVNNAIHMYYDVIPSNGMIMITNTGDGIISVTDLQYTAPTFGMFKVSRSLMSYVQSFDERTVVEPEVVVPEVEETPAPTEPTPTPTPDTPDDPTPTPSISNWISQLFSNFVSSLFGSIARLFGGH